MAAPAGPCEWCGGPQLWTFVRNEMYVSCRLGCLPLPLGSFVTKPCDRQPSIDGGMEVARELPESGAGAGSSAVDSN